MTCVNIGLQVPSDQVAHLIETTLDRAMWDLALQEIRHNDVSASGILPAWSENRDVFLCCCQKPGIMWVRLVELLKIAIQQKPLEEFTRQQVLVLVTSLLVLLQQQVLKP